MSDIVSMRDVNAGKSRPHFQRSSSLKSSSLMKARSKVVFFGFLLSSTSSHALGQQILTNPTQNQAGPDAPPAIEEVVVTGSRIARSALNQPNPVTQLSADAIESTGLAATVDVLSELPELQNSNNSENNNRYTNGAGQEQPNLRGLGTYRTLTLIDGIRQVGSLSGINNSGGTSTVDLATIPPLLIDHVDIVTGGSSAVYGADAVAGVVNVILKKAYQGAELTLEGGSAEGGGKGTFTADGIVGTNFAQDRGNLTMAFDYSTIGSVDASQRNYATQNKIWELNPNPNGATFVPICCTTSSIYAASGAATIATPIGSAPAYSLAVTPNGKGLTQFDRGSIVPGAGNYSVGGDGINTTQFDTLETPNQRVVIEPRLDFDLAEDIGPFETINFSTDLKYADSSGDFNTVGAFSNGTPGDSARSALTIQASNPYVPAALASLLRANNLSSFDITRYSADWGLRNFAYDYQYFRAVVGFDGRFTNDWKYQLYFNYGRNDTSFVNSDRITDLFSQQIDAVTDPSTGKIVCRIALTQATSCVPINPFVVGPLTAAQQSYAYTYTHENDTLQQYDMAGNVSGKLFSYNPVGSESSLPVEFASGFEWRRDTTNSMLDPLSLQPEGTIYGNQEGLRPIVGAIESAEGYGEVDVPLARDLRFVKELNFDAAIRLQNYNTTGFDYTWNLQGTWTVNDEIRFRGGVAKSVRAPNADELYSTGGQAYVAIADPCSYQYIGQNATRTANCRAAGIPVGYDDTTAAAASTNITGNPGLNPEVGHSITAGVVLTPSMVPGFKLGIDYFHIRIDHAIVTLDPNSTVDDCYDSGKLCNFVQRNADGSLNTVQSPYVNAGYELEQGVDFDAAYQTGLERIGLDDGAIRTEVSLSWVPQHYLVPFSNDPSQNEDLAGTLGYPRLAGIWRTTYDQGPLSVTFAVRYTESTEEYANVPGQTYSPTKTGDVWYEDISARYQFGRVTLFGGINNLLNRIPPQIPGLYNGGNFPDANGNLVNQYQANAAFSTVGRYFFAGISAKL